MFSGKSVTHAGYRFLSSSLNQKKIYVNLIRCVCPVRSQKPLDHEVCSFLYMCLGPDLSFLGLEKSSMILSFIKYFAKVKTTQSYKSNESIGIRQ